MSDRFLARRKKIWALEKERKEAATANLAAAEPDAPNPWKQVELWGDDSTDDEYDRHGSGSETSED